jgi:hypothetical protein
LPTLADPKLANFKEIFKELEKHKSINHENEPVKKLMKKLG